MKLTEIEAVEEVVLEESDDGVTFKEARKGATFRRANTIKGLVTAEIGIAIKSEVEAKEGGHAWTQFHQDADVTSYCNKQVEDPAMLRIESLQTWIEARDKNTTWALQVLFSLAACHVAVSLLL